MTNKEKFWLFLILFLTILLGAMLLSGCAEILSQGKPYSTVCQKIGDRLYCDNY